MSSMRPAHASIAALALAVAGLALPGHARACGAAPEAETFFSFGAPAPSAASSGVSRDSPIVVVVNAHQSDGSQVFSEHPALDRAALTDANGQAVPLRMPQGEPWLGTTFTLVFAASAP